MPTLLSLKVTGLLFLGLLSLVRHHSALLARFLQQGSPQHRSGLLIVSSRQPVPRRNPRENTLSRVSSLIEILMMPQIVLAMLTENQLARIIRAVYLEFAAAAVAGLILLRVCASNAWSGHYLEADS